MLYIIFGFRIIWFATKFLIEIRLHLQISFLSALNESSSLFSFFIVFFTVFPDSSWRRYFVLFLPFHAIWLVIQVSGLWFYDLQFHLVFWPVLSLVNNVQDHSRGDLYIYRVSVVNWLSLTYLCFLDEVVYVLACVEGWSFHICLSPVCSSVCFQQLEQIGPQEYSTASQLRSPIGQPKLTWSLFWGLFLRFILGK